MNETNQMNQINPSRPLAEPNRGTLHVEAGSVKQAYLVCFVDLVHLVQPNRPDKPNKPNNVLWRWRTFVIFC
jgi:hypothetical protein